MLDRSLKQFQMLISQKSLIKQNRLEPLSVALKAFCVLLNYTPLIMRFKDWFMLIVLFIGVVLPILLTIFVDPLYHWFLVMTIPLSFVLIILLYVVPAIFTSIVKKSQSKKEHTPKWLLFIYTVIVVLAIMIILDGILGFFLILSG